MRVQPVGLLPDAECDEDTRAALAQFQAALTHGHPTGLAASDLTAFAVHDLARGGDPGGLPSRMREYAVSQRTNYREEWLGPLFYARSERPEEFMSRGWDECLGVLDRLDAALAAPERYPLSGDADPCEATGDGWIAEEALATGLLCFLLYPDEPVTALRRAALTRGDSDSLACLTGAFAGAHHGIGAWPAEWVERIEYRDRLQALADRWDA
jgi:ADP-ribosylglycohydrolase